MRSLIRYVALLWMFLGYSFSQQQIDTSVPADAPQVRTEIHTVESLLPKLRGRGEALYLLATDYAHLGDHEKALALLKECVLLDEGFDPSAEPALQPLKSNAEFQSLLARALRQYPAVHKAHVAFTLAEKDLIPEGLAVDPGEHVFYASSLFRQKIVKITANGETSDFSSADHPDWGPICGVKVAAWDRSVWANVCADNGVGAELLHFGSEGKLVERFPAPDAGKHLFNDLVLRNADEIYLTDSLANVAYRFDGKSRQFTALSLPRPMYYPNGIALSEDGNWLYIADAFGVFQYDLRNHVAREVEPGPSHTLADVDGLYWYKSGLVAVQNGLGLPRVARIHLAPDGWHVTTLEVLEYRSRLMSVPTTGAIVESDFYFIANSQIDNMKDQKIVDADKLRPVVIGVVPLGK